MIESFGYFCLGVALTLFTLSQFGCIHVDLYTHDDDDDDSDDGADPDVWPAGRRFVRRD